jgi:hypothetical protein
MPDEIEIDDLPVAIALTNGDSFLVYQSGAGAEKTRRVTYQALMASVVQTDEDATLGVVTADSLAAPVANLNAVVVTTSLTLGAVLSRLIVVTASVAVSTLAAAASEDVTMTATGAVVGDMVILNPTTDMPDGLHLRAYVSAANTVRINVTNASGASVTGASYTVKALVLRVA